MPYKIRPRLHALPLHEGINVDGHIVPYFQVFLPVAARVVRIKSLSRCQEESDVQYLILPTG